MKPKRCLVCGKVLRDFNKSLLCHTHLAIKLRESYARTKWRREYQKKYMKAYRKKQSLL